MDACQYTWKLTPRNHNRRRKCYNLGLSSRDCGLRFRHHNSPWFKHCGPGHIHRQHRIQYHNRLLLCIWYLCWKYRYNQRLHPRLNNYSKDIHGKCFHRSPILQLFIINGSSFNNLLGSGLTNSGGALTVDDVGPTQLASSDFGDFTCNGTTCSLDTTYATLVANTFTGLQTFNYSSSTAYSSFLTASTTNFNLGGSSFVSLLGTGLSLSSGALTTTLGTSIDISSETNLAATYPIILTGDTLSTAFGTTTNNTFDGVQTFNYASTTYGSFTTATSTNANIGTLTLSPINGPLQANGGLVSATTSIGVLYGGTGATDAGTARTNLGVINYTDAAVNSYINGSTTIPKTYTANVFSALQTLAYSSSTAYSSFNYASTTNLILNGQSFNNLLGTGLKNTSGALTLDTAVANSWTALQTFNYSSTTAYASFNYASTTNLIVNGSSFNNLLGSGLTNSSGALTVDDVGPTQLASSDFGDFTCNGTTCSLDTTYATLVANTFTGLQTMAYSSSTAYSSFLTSSSTNASIGLLTLSTTTAGSLFVNSSGVVYSGTAAAASIAIGSSITDATAGSVLFNGSGGLAQDNASFFWKQSGPALGLGKTTPYYMLTLASSTAKFNI